MDAVLGVHINKQMHMVWHHFQLDELRLASAAHSGHDLFERFVGPINQYRATVLRAPHNVVLARKNDVAIGAIGTGHNNSI